MTAEDRDIHSLLEKMCQYILDRFADLGKSPVSDIRVFDFRLRSPTLTELSTYENSEFKSLCQYYSDVLTEDEVKLAQDQWQTLKVQVSMQRKYHPLAVYSSILQRQESLMHINTLLSLLFTVSPSTASCERVFFSPLCDPWDRTATCLITAVCMTADSGVVSLIPGGSHTFLDIDHEMISMVIIIPSPDSFKKCCCQIQVKLHAQITG